MWTSKLIVILKAFFTLVVAKQVFEQCKLQLDKYLTICSKFLTMIRLKKLHKQARHENNDDEEKSKKLFEWYDGPLVSSMTCGDHILVDEISLAEDSVLERLNSVLEQERKLNVPDRIVEVNIDFHQLKRCL